MSSPLQEIADTLAVEFRDAVIDAERNDMETIEAITKDMNLAFQSFQTREATLNTQAEQAVTTLKEIADLRGVNMTDLQRRITTLKETLTEFRETKIAAKAEALGNVVKLEKMVEKA